MSCRRHLSSAAAALALGLVLATVPAQAQRGVAGPAAQAPPLAAKLGPLCRADSPNVRVWWSDRPGAPGALADGDGNCATLPTAVGQTLDAAERARALAVSMGFPATRGDADPPVLRNAALTRQLLRAPAGLRWAALAQMGSTVRGRYLAGLTAAQRTRMLRGLPRAGRTRLTRDLRRAIAGRPADFVGGDRRLDIVLDGSGASGTVQSSQPGRANCQTRGTGRGRSFNASWLFVLARPGDAVRPVVAHEMFHAAQCQLGLTSAATDLLVEGTADWFSALAEPAEYPGTVTDDGVQISVTGGNSRVASFCNRFDPQDLSGVSPYTSWSVWQALDNGPRSTVVLPLLRRFGSRPLTPAALIAQVGAARWTEALQVAARATCGVGTSPDGRVTFSPEVADFIGLGAPAATPEAVGMVQAPAGGVASLRVDWRRTAPAAVSLLLSADGVAPQLLAERVTVASGDGVQPVVVRDGVATVDLPAAAVATGRARVTVAAPSTTAPLAVRVQVVATP